METFHKLSRIHGQFGAIIRIATERRGDVFMSVTRSNYMNDRRAVVEVDSSRFLNLWRQRQSSHPEIAAGSPSTWVNDYKFHYAEDGFKEGETNPVPLANVSCGTMEEKNSVWKRRSLFFKELERIDHCSENYLSFTDGITRTLWLLTFGAKIFPVECRFEEAALLHSLAGNAGTEVRTIDELPPVHEERKFFEAMHS